MFDRSLAISLNVHNPEGCVGTLMTDKHAESIGLRTQVLTFGDRQISYVEPDTQENWNHLEQSLCSTYNLTIWKNGGVVGHGWCLNRRNKNSDLLQNVDHSHDHLDPGQTCGQSEGCIHTF